MLVSRTLIPHELMVGWVPRYYEAQVAIGEAIQGWVYWTWKVEDADDWSYQRGLEGGWIPQDPSDRMYPDICSSN